MTAGTVKLIGWRRESVVEAVSELWDHPAAYERFARATNPYGDGLAADRIAAVLSESIRSISRRRVVRFHPGHAWRLR